MFNTSANGSSLSASNASLDIDSLTTFQNVPNSEEFDIKKFYGIFICMYAVVIIVGVTGNGMLVYTILKCKRFHSVTNYFIASLAFSDFFVCITCMPFTLVHRLQFPYWPFGHFLCHFVTTIQMVSVFVSTWTLTAIAIDRYVLICHPMRSRMSTKKCFITIIVIWIISISFALPTGIYTTMYDLRAIVSEEYLLCLEIWPNIHQQLVYSIMTFVVQYLFPVFIITVLYLRIGIRLKNRISPGARTVEQELQQHRLKRKTHLLMTLVVFAFALCWLPLYLIRFIDDLDFLRFSQRVTIDAKYYAIVYTLSHWFAMTSVCYNPFLYAWYHENFFRIVKQMFSCLLQLNTVPQIIPSYGNGQSSNVNEM